MTFSTVFTTEYTTRTNNAIKPQKISQQTVSHSNKLQITSIQSSIAGSSTVGFISKWNTSLSGISSSTSISLPLEKTGVYDFNVSWGDGNSNTITTYTQTATNHTYSKSGIYTVNITGTIEGWNFNSDGDELKLIEISNWGPLQLGNSGAYFKGASNLVLTANDSLNLIGTTNLSNTFMGCTNLGNIGNMNSWSTSQVTDMSYMFQGASSFNQPLSNWDVGTVTNMEYMFYGAVSFNQSLNSWIVSKVTNMNHMFQATSLFNQPLSNWDVQAVTTMKYMFAGAYYFNQSLSTWDVSHVTDMSFMFSEAISFNQPLGSWNVAQVTNMASMFQGDRLSIANYDNLILGWSQLTLQNGVTFDAGSSAYNSTATTAYAVLTNTFGWIITDGGLAIAPSAPQNVQTSVGNFLVNVTWTAPSSNGSTDIISYTIYRSSTSGSGFVAVKSVSSSTFYYTDNSVTNGQTYYYMIKASNSYLSSYSTEVSATPIGDPLPPQSLQASSGNGFIYLSWSAPTSNGGYPLTNYTIYKTTTMIGDFVADNAMSTTNAEIMPIVTVNASTLSYNDTSVTDGLPYYYFILAYNSFGHSSFSNDASAIPEPIVPSAPQSLQASAGNDFIFLSWLAPTSNGGSPLTNYSIYRSLTSGSDYTLLKTVNASILSFNDTSVTDGLTYYYFVTANNSIGQSQYSNGVSASFELAVTSSSTTTTSTSTKTTTTATTTTTTSATKSKSKSTPSFELISVLVLLFSFSFVKGKRSKKD